MCGIFGYVGKEGKTAALILDGLKRLEYRGYDSWGVAVKKTRIDGQKAKFIMEKHVGKIGNSALCSQLSALSSSLGIGHTRWATHGGVTVQNAHPHLDCPKTIAVVHNGIVENYEELKKRLQRRGHRFLSETDTEVIPHLIEENLKQGKGFTTSVRDAFNEISGRNAIVVANTVSREIIAVKTGSPLVIGISDGELFVASDASALIPHTRKVIFLADLELAVLGDGVKVIQLPKGALVSRSPQIIEWKLEETEKGEFKHFLLKEIFDQGKSIADAINQNEKNIHDFASLIKKSFGTYVVGCGTAGFACRMATYIFSVIAKKHLNFCVGSEFAYFEHFLKPKSLLIAASQSGETADILEAVAAAKKHNSKVLALVNAKGSTLERESDMMLPLKAGPEKAVLSTKAFTAKVAIFYLLAYILAGKYKEGRQILLKTAQAAEDLLNDEKLIRQIRKIANEIYQVNDIYILGRGLSFPLAREAAHKIKEASYIHAEGFAGGEPKHCEISLISKGTPTIVFVPNDETKSAISSNAMEFKSRGAYIIGIAPENQPIFDEWIKVPDLGITSSLVNIIPAQLLAYFLAVKRGLDPDKPRNLAKSVTVK